MNVARPPCFIKNILETARIILGHRSAAITEVYAELNQQKALEAIVRVG